MLKQSEMKRLLKRFWDDAYIRNSAIFFSGSMFVAFLNYLRYPLLSRVLPVESFGEVQALLAVYSEIAMALGAFSMATIHLSANCEDADECAAVAQLFRNASFVLVAVMVAGVVIGAQVFASALHFANPVPFLVLGVMLLVSALYSVRLGYLQGQSRFGRAVIASSIVSGSGLLCIALFTYLGWGTAGAIGGIVAGQVLALGFVWFNTRHALKRHPDKPFVLTPARAGEELRHVGCTFVTLASLTILYTADTIVVKRYFPAVDAGLYSGVSTVSNIVVFASAPLASVMLSAIKRSHSLAQNLHALRKGLLGVGAVGGAVTFGFALIPSFVVKALMGAKYLPYAQLLPLQSVAFFCVALANVLVMYSLALRRYTLTVVAGCACALLVALTLAHHARLEEVVQNFTLTGAGTLLVSGYVVLRDLRRPSVPPSAP